MEESHGGAAICVSQKGDPGDDHARSVRGPPGRRDRPNADFRRSDSALRAGWSWLDACSPGDWRLHNGVGGGASTPDAAGWQNLTLVCFWFWNCDNPVWLVKNPLVITRAVISCRRI